ncbi:MAG: response regulator transcription factor [Formivibrio sp.]|nr:response regulator transcription factor [Formivibrio sp.]
MHTAIVVDDHPFIRATVKMLLKQKGIEVVAEADNGVDALDQARQLDPDLILLDIAMPRLDVMDVIARIQNLGLRSKIIVLTSLPAQFYSMRCMKAGAVGFLTKNREIENLLIAIDAVLAGNVYFPIAGPNTVSKADLFSTEEQMINTLSDRELSILQKLAVGMNNNQIAEELMLSNKTIATYRSRITEKLSAKSLIQLADIAARNKLI